MGRITWRCRRTVVHDTGRCVPDRERLLPPDGRSCRFPLPQGADVHFEPGTQRRSIGTDLLRTPINAPQGRCGEGCQGRQDNCRTSTWDCGIAHPEAMTHGARLFALEGVIGIPLRRDRHFFPLHNDPVPFPLTLRTAIAGRQGHGNGNPKTVSTRTFYFGWPRRILILGHLHDLASATLGAAQRRLLLLIAVHGTW